MVLGHLTASRRGQMNLLAVVVIGSFFVASLILLNYGLLATIDRSEGVTQTSEAEDAIANIESNLQSALIQSNRGHGNLNDLINDQQAHIAASSQYRREDVSLTVVDEVSGTRVSTGTDGTLTASGLSNWEIINKSNSDLVTGGIEIQTEESNLPVTSDPKSDGSFRVETDEYDIYVYRPAEAPSEVEALWVGSSEKRYRTNSSKNPYLDLGEGSFDGYVFPGYDQSTVDSISIYNGDRVNGSIEMVATDIERSHSSLQTNSATFGVVLDVTFQSETATTSTTTFITHGPVGGSIP
jgi:hypothetical protein